LRPLADGNPVEIESQTSHLAMDVIFRTLFSVPVEHEIASGHAPDGLATKIMTTPDPQTGEYRDGALQRKLSALFSACLATGSGVSLAGGKGHAGAPLPWPVAPGQPDVQIRRFATGVSDDGLSYRRLVGRRFVRAASLSGHLAAGTDRLCRALRSDPRLFGRGGI
jgi:hypothetical protein